MSASPTQGRFRYGLQPLLDLRQWQLDLLKADMSAAERLLVERENALQIQAATVAQCRAWLQELRQEGRRLDLDREGVLRRYLPQAEERLAAAREACDEAEQQRDTVMHQLQRAHRAARGLETHRDKRQQSHAAAQEVWRAKEADETWLISVIGRKAAT
jgi:predicted  nucleic acid-binding Zn-ribbon protein